MFVFFGTSHRSAKFLEIALQKGLKVDLIVSQKPKPTGKKQILTINPTVLIAESKKIPFVLNLSDLDKIKDLKLGIILDYNQIIPSSVINLFKMGIINIHFSKLPVYRGPAPVQYTILSGDKQAWITFYLIDEKLDNGMILNQTALSLDLTENTETLYQKLIEKSATEAKEIIQKYLEGEINPKIQFGTPSITHKLTTQNCQIDWTKTSEEIEKLIRAAYPEPTAWTNVQFTIHNLQFKKRLKILKAHLKENKLVLDQVQLEGKNPVSWKQFQQGYPKAVVF